MHWGCFIWTPSPPFSGRRTPRPGPACVCVPAPPDRVGRAGLPDTLWCASPSSAAVLSFFFVQTPRAGVARASGVFFSSFFSFFSPLCSLPPFAPPLSLGFVLPGPGCPGPWRSLFLLRSPPPLVLFFCFCFFRFFLFLFFFLTVFPLLHPPLGPLCCCFWCLWPWRFFVRPPPFPPPPLFFLFFPRCVNPYLCPLFVPPLCRRFRCFRPWLPWALALCHPSLAVVSFLFVFFRFPVVGLPSRFSLVPGALGALGLWCAWQGSYFLLHVRPCV